MTKFQFTHYHFLHNPAFDNDFLEEEDNLLDDIQVLPDQDELLATSPVAHIHDNYPQLQPPQDFCERMVVEHVTHPGLC